MGTVADKWIKGLHEAGYEHHVFSPAQCEKLRKFSRIWKRILRHLPLEPEISLSVFEFGCGGGKQLVMFALNGWRCVGLDCSESVLLRAKNYINEVVEISHKKLDVGFICADFLSYQPPPLSSYDVVFHVGVLEHFLNEEERLLALKKMFELAKPGGYVISIVPSGVHPLRSRMRTEGLGGYDIPEIDYTPMLMNEEFKKMEASEPKIFAHNLFGYLLIDTAQNKITRLIKKIFFYFLQLIPPSFLTEQFSNRHGTTLVGIARKKI